MSENITVNSEYLYRGRVITLRLDTIQTKDGAQYKREVVEHHGAVAIVPMLDAETVLMIRQYRQAAAQYMLEIPAGTLEEDENPDDCASRELEEEIGYKPGILKPMFSQYLAPGYSSEILHVYLASDLVKSHTNFDEDEDIELVPIKFTEVERMIRQGEIRDAKSIAALLMADIMRND